MSGKGLRYLSVCAGIEAATVAWHTLGWTPVAFSEVDAFPSAVLAHHYPHVPNWGDMTTFKDWPDATVDLLVGGTPCQSFSIAGLRKGLDDPRGNLMLTWLALAGRYRPRWLVWENVPGVLSSNGGRDFAALLGGLAELGYGFAYRVLDAQFFGVAQRRRRVFVVGHLGSWQRAAAVLFERASLSGHPAPRREAGQNAPTIPARRTAGGGFGTDFDGDGGLIAGVVSADAADVTSALCAADGPKGVFDQYAHEGMVAMSSGQANAEITHGFAPALTCLHEAPIVAHSPRADGFDESEDGTGRGTPLVPTYVQDVADPLVAKEQGTYTHEGTGNFRTRNVTAVAFQPRIGRNGRGYSEDVVPAMAVRRLTPRECERLQGFPTSREHANIDVCFDPHSGVVSVVLSCRRSLNDASPVDAAESKRCAKPAGANSSTHLVGQGPHVLVHARMQSEAALQALLSHGKSIWSANSADASNASRRPTEIAKLAAAVVQRLPALVTETLNGKAGSPANIRLFMRAESGVRHVAMYGDASAASANDATSGARSEKFTTSDLGRLIPQDDSIAATSLCCVFAAISGCIPSEILPESFSVELLADIPYTLIPYRGKPAADGPRYKALGNSMAVPVMRWIGQRIAQVEQIGVDDER